MGVLALVAGALLAAFGGDRFVRGCVGTSTVLRVPAGIIGATVAAFATSSPELVVAVLSAARGDSSLALGNAAGSNVVNLGLVLGATLVVVPVVARRGDLRRELPALLALTVAVGLLAIDGEISRLDAAAVLVGFGVWAVWVAYDARAARDLTPEVVGDTSRAAALRDVAIGGVLLVVSGRLLLEGAGWVGDTLGWDDFLTGAVLVAVATSMPELATTFISIRRGHVEVGLGALLGSNVFNIGFVVGVTGVVQPIPVELAEVSVALVAGVVAALLVVPGVRGVLGRGRGALLIGCYAAYTAGLFVVR